MIRTSYDSKAGQYVAQHLGHIAYGDTPGMAKDAVTRLIKRAGIIPRQPRFHRQDTIAEMSLQSRFIRRRSA